MRRKITISLLLGFALNIAVLIAVVALAAAGKPQPAIWFARTGEPLGMVLAAVLPHWLSYVLFPEGGAQAMAGFIHMAVTIQNTVVLAGVLFLLMATKSAKLTTALLLPLLLCAAARAAAQNTPAPDVPTSGTPTSTTSAAPPTPVSPAIVWEPLPSKMADGRWAGTATRLSDGRVLVAGGYSYAKKDTVPSADLWDARTGAFAPAPPMERDRNFATATLLESGDVLVAGGFSELFGTWDRAEVFRARENRWEPVAGRMYDHRELFAATRLPGGSVLLTGGLSLKKRTTVNTAEVYNPGIDGFEAVGEMGDDRFGHAAVALADGRVLVVGGKSWRIGGPDRALASAEIYDPATRRFSPTGPLKAARDRPTATLLKDGRVLVAGGSAAGASVRTAEIFDPKTGLFTDAGTLVEGRMAHEAALLRDGRVLLVGGWSDDRRSSLASTEIYDPAAGTFAGGPELPFAALDFGLVQTDGGSVLVVGGKTSTGDEKTAASVETAALLKLP